MGDSEFDQTRSKNILSFYESSEPNPQKKKKVSDNSTTEESTEEKATWTDVINIKRVRVLIEQYSIRTTVVGMNVVSRFFLLDFLPPNKGNNNLYLVTN